MRILIYLLFITTSLFSYGQKILPAEEGVTLAQIAINNRTHTLLVLADNKSNITAVDLSNLYNTYSDMISVYHAIGYAKLVELAQKSELDSQLFPTKELLSPAGRNHHHVAAGLNYGKHADEVNSTQQPFLFVKYTEPTREQDIMVNPKELLDYEVELCARPLITITQQPNFNEPAFGFFLCGDFTDRAELLRGIELENMQSGRGFSRAKSKKGYFPTGPYMVISKNWQNFIANTKLSLTLNGQLKQQESANQMIWSLSTILEKTWQHNDNNLPVHTSEVATLLPNRKVSQHMVFLTGTPEGVMFRPPGVDFKIQSTVKYLFSGAFIDTKLTDYVVEQYSQSKLQEKALLQPGDNLRLRANYLGQINLKISEPVIRNH